MKIGICEDEATFLEYEYKKIKEFFLARGQQVQILTYPDGTALLQDYADKAPFDLLVLDLQMTQSDGMEIAREIRKTDSTVPILFVTGVESRALEGYHVEAFDYIIKSQLDTRLEDSLSRFFDKYNSSTLAVETADGEMAILPFDSILYMESEKRGTKIVTADTAYYSAHPIGKLSAQLPGKEFSEIYKSVFVRLRSIKRIGNDYVEMVGGDTLPLSRRKKKAVMSLVLELVKGRL